MPEMPSSAPPPYREPEELVEFDGIVDYGVGRLNVPGSGHGRESRGVPEGVRLPESDPEAVEAEVLEDVPTNILGRELARIRREQRRGTGWLRIAAGTTVWVAGGLWWFVRCLFGIASIILALAVVSAIPVLNFIALGYLLSVEGRVARSGRFRDAFPLVTSVAPRLGSIALGFWLCLIPLRLLSNAAADARIIDAGSGADRFLHLLLPVASVLMVAHVCFALVRGGGLHWFLWPVWFPLAGPVMGAVAGLRRLGATWLPSTGGFFNKFRPRWPSEDEWLRSETAVANFVAALNLREHFWLGFRGFFGAFLWLVIPTAFFAFARTTEGGAILVTLFGGLLLIVTLSWVPFLQAHFAAENRFSAMFELREVRRLYGNSPLLWLLTVVLTLALALPLYLAKVVLPPSDAMWTVTLLFIVTIFPVKVLTGWAYHRAALRPRKAFFLWRYLCWLLMFPLLGFYVFLLFFTQFLGEHGKGVLFEHHAFLLPVPF